MSQVKGWCPGAHHPMMSGDGLVLRVRPFLATLTAAQALGLCALAQRFGNGVLDLTSRANVQLRGVAEPDYPTLLAAMRALGVIDADPTVEARRNVLVAPDWQPGDLTHRLHRQLLATLPVLPALPSKMGFALDTGATPILRSGSADFRFETDAQGRLLLCADGANGGRIVSETEAMTTVHELVAWFLRSGGTSAGRMARHLAKTPLPAIWRAAPRQPEVSRLEVGPSPAGPILGVAFGAMEARALHSLMQSSGASALRLMLGRRIWLRDGQACAAPGFTLSPDDPVLKTHACAGAPFCTQASVETRALAAQLAPRVQGALHVSGCAKGCAFPKGAAITLTGRKGQYDLIREGCASDAPDIRGLTIDDLAKALP